MIPGYRESRLYKPYIDPQQKFVLPISASSLPSPESKALKISADRYCERQFDMDDLCYTLSRRRSNLPKRGFLITSSATLNTDCASVNLITSHEAYSQLPIGFVFTGQGSQWPQMGKQLFETYPEYQKTIEYLDDIIKTLPEAPSWTLKEALLEPVATSRVSQVDQSQPLCTAGQIDLLDILRGWGVVPTVTWAIHRVRLQQLTLLVY